MNARPTLIDTADSLAVIQAKQALSKLWSLFR